jgi:hypothetical protein
MLCHANKNYQNFNHISHKIINLCTLNAIEPHPHLKGHVGLDPAILQLERVLAWLFSDSILAV